jgi:hypothetical protein
MTTIERRLSDLERARSADLGPLVLFVDDVPTEEQRRASSKRSESGARLCA